MHGHVGTLLWTICYFCVVLGLSAYGIHRYSIIYLYFKNRHRKPALTSKFDLLPVVTVQLPIYNEVHVVERLLKAISELDYPRDKLEIQVLDDSTDETRELTERRFVNLQARGFAAVVRHPTIVSDSRPAHWITDSKRRRVIFSLFWMRTL